MVGGAALFVISALVYYRINPELEATSFLQHTIVGIYNVFGLAPSVVFFLMVFAWSSIWAVTGILERPLARLGRLLVMALMVAVFLNLRSAGVSSGDHTGAFGSWIAERLVIGIGYVFSLVLVGPAMFASMMLATDWFFSEWFERDRKTTNFEEGEEGVEDGVTDHLRRLSGVASRPESGPTPEAGAATAVDLAVGDDGVDHSEIAAQLQRADAFGTSSVVEDVEAEDVEAEDADGDAEIVPTRPLSYSGRRLQRAERRIREGEAVEAQAVENIESEAAEAVSVPPPSSGAVMVTEEELESLFDQDAVAAPDQADARATDDGLAEDGLAEDVEASLAVAEEDEDDVDAESEDELDDEFEEGDELEDDEESEDDDELEDDEESEDDDELEDEDEESEDDDEFEDEDEESEDDDELEDEDEESEDDDELEDEDEESEDDDEFEDEDEESVDESETEYAEFDGEHEAAEASDVNEDEEVFVTDDGLESEGAISEEESFVTESAASVEEFVSEDLPSAAEPAIAVVDEQIEQEEVVSIPRPDEVPAVALPTPPAVRDSAESFSTRQQKLFGSQVDDDLMVEAVELVDSGRRTTATLLQRKLRIDYELAVEVLSELTTRGLVSDDHDRS
jgi:hypothetical protein